MGMPGRKFTAGNEYRYGFNGKEKLDEIYGEGNAYNLGDRGLDARIGRTFKPDAKGAMFPNVSPYSFAMNSPLNAVDPDGKVVIFINGYYGFPTAACCGGTEKHWGKNWVSRAQSQIGDKKSRFYDGSLGGPSGVVFGQGDPVIGNSSSMDPATRRLAGYNLGKIEAADIINNLERDASGNITESIKFVTSSMGAAYQRGFSQAMVDYVGEQNAIIDTYNNGLAKNKDGSYKDPSAVKQRLNVNIEFTVDLDAFQGSELSADPNSKANYYMVNDGVESKVIGSAVSGSKQIGVDAKGKTTMKGHHPSWADPKALPQGKQNPKGSSKKENPSD